MDLAPGFHELLQGLSPTLTAPSFASLCTIISGWLFSGRGIVTRMIAAPGAGATKHFSSHHRLLRTASWSLDAMGLAVFAMIEPFLGDVVMLGLDDTLARKRGPRMFGARMHHDPLASTRSLAFVRWGHSWVALGVIVDFPFRAGHWIFLPLLFRPYVNRQAVATAPLAMLRHTLVVLWFAKEGHRLWQPPTHRWYPSKADPSFTDMLRTLRRARVRQHVLAMAPTGRGSRKLARLVENAVAMAA